MHVFIRVCTDRRFDVVKRQFSVDGQEWQRHQEAKQLHDDLRALFVPVGISATFFMRLTTAGTKWNHGIQELYAARLCPAYVRIICSSFIKRCTPNEVDVVLIAHRCSIMLN